MYPRRPTATEWSQLSNWFPDLEAADVWVEGPQTSEYNCIAWALGYTDRWINPPPSVDAFTTLFLGAHPRHYTTRLAALDPQARADGYANAGGGMTHGARRDGGTWSSKLGAYLRITHNRRGLEGATYGSIIVSYE